MEQTSGATAEKESPLAAHPRCSADKRWDRRVTYQATAWLCGALIMAMPAPGCAQDDLPEPWRDREARDADAVRTVTILHILGSERLSVPELVLCVRVEGGKDLPRGLAQRLVERGVSALPGSQCVAHASGVRVKGTDVRGAIIHIDTVSLKASGRAVVTGGYYVGGKAFAHATYDLQHSVGGWRVVGAVVGPRG